jgi:hypothetical protein
MEEGMPLSRIFSPEGIYSTKMPKAREILGRAKMYESAKVRTCGRK